MVVAFLVLMLLLGRIVLASYESLLAFLVPYSGQLVLMILAILEFLFWNFLSFLSIGLDTGCSVKR